MLESVKRAGLWLNSAKGWVAMISVAVPAAAMFVSRAVDGLNWTQTIVATLFVLVLVAILVFVGLKIAELVSSWFGKKATAKRITEFLNSYESEDKDFRIWEAASIWKDTDNPRLYNPELLKLKNAAAAGEFVATRPNAAGLYNKDSWVKLSELREFFTKRGII